MKQTYSKYSAISVLNVFLYFNNDLDGTKIEGRLAKFANDNLMGQ